MSNRMALTNNALADPGSHLVSGGWKGRVIDHNHPGGGGQPIFDG